LVCNYCGSYKRKGKWESGKKTLEKILIDELWISDEVVGTSIKIDFSDIHNVGIDYSGIIKGIQIKGKKFVEIVEQKGVCDRCSRIKGGYFEAILQVRTTNRNLSQKEKEIIGDLIEKNISNSFSFVSKVVEINNGIDYYIGDKIVAEHIAILLKKKFHGIFKKSSTLVGKKDGRNVYRTTYLVRLPEYRSGDLIQMGDKIFKIMKIGERVKMIDLSSLLAEDYSHKELSKGKLIIAQKKEAIVVYESSGELHLMDPWTYETKVVRKPENFPSQKEVKVIKWNGNLYLVDW
jgi:nonsense-mediated mRNA decay protein 3